MEASSAIWLEQTPEAALDRLAKSLTFLVGAIAVQISRIDGNRLVDIAQHKLRDIDLGDDLAYLIEDFPVTKQVLETGSPRAISFSSNNFRIRKRLYEDLFSGSDCANNRVPIAAASS